MKQRVKGGGTGGSGLHRILSTEDMGPWEHGYCESMLKKGSSGCVRRMVNCAA